MGCQVYHSVRLFFRGLLHLPCDLQPVVSHVVVPNDRYHPLLCRYGWEGSSLQQFVDFGLHQLVSFTDVVLGEVVDLLFEPLGIVFG